MKITVQNLDKEFNKIEKGLPKTIVENYDTMVNVLIPLYKEDKEIKETVDLYILKINEFVNSKTGASKHIKSEKKKTPVKKTKVNKPVQKKVTVKKDKEPKQYKDYVKNRVEDVPEEVKLFKRYINLHNKKITKRNLLLIHKTLEKLAIAKKIRKSSEYADLLMQIDKDIVSTYNENRTDSIDFIVPEKLLMKLAMIVEDTKERFSISYIKRFINLLGNNTKEKSEALIKLIKAALANGKIKESDPYIKHIHAIKSKLQHYISNNTSIAIETPVLRGLEKISGVKKKPVEIPKRGAISFDNVNQLESNPIGFTGKWKTLLGNPNKNSRLKIMAWGTGGSGKSSMALLFIYYLAKTFNKKIAFVVGEEDITGTFKEKVERLKISHPNLHAYKALNDVPYNEYDWVVIDSITTLDIPAKKLWELYGKHPKVSFINIHHALKDGDNFKGDSDYQHDIDVEIKVWFDEKAKKHFAQCVKNRWCGNHEIIEVF